MYEMRTLSEIIIYGSISSYFIIIFLDYREIVISHILLLYEGINENLVLNLTK